MTDLWYPQAIRSPVPHHESGSGRFNDGAAKIVHHTTEGATYGGAFGAYQASGNLPHFTDSFEAGSYRVYQHLPLNVAASALAHPLGTGETNRDNAIQIEHVGFAAASAAFDPLFYAGMAALCHWIEQQTRCKPRPYAGPRMPWAAWHIFSGHCGHMHVPNNDHSDPGRGFRWDRVTGGIAPPPGPQPPTHFPGDNVDAHNLHVDLDSNGNGYVDGSVDRGHLASVVINGADPATSGYVPVPRVSAVGREAGVTRFVFEGGPAKGGVDFTAWTAS